MMLAQSLVEYGAVGSIASELEQLAGTAVRWAGSLSPTTWAIVGAIVLLALVAKRR